MTTTNRTTELNADQKLIDGLTKHRAAIAGMPIGGQTLTPDQAIAILQARIDSSNQSLTTKASAKAAVLAERGERTGSKTFVSSLRQVICSMFTSADTLADFGLTLPKPHLEDPQTKVEAAAKARATRALRHTMGKNQKAAIKATGPVPTDTPATPATAGQAPQAPLAPAAPATPAAPPAGATAPAASPAGTTPTAHTQS